MKLGYIFLGIALIPAMLLPVSGLQHESELKQLYDGRQWFRLRDAVLNGDAPELYRGAVACAFLDLQNAEKHLRNVIRAAPRSEDATEARGLLITVYQLANEYGKAFAEIRALQAAVPSERGLDNGAVFFRILERLPRQRTVARPHATVHGRFHDGNLFVPVSVNGKTSHYIIDTGANFSAMPESEARRLGLTVHISLFLDTGATRTRLSPRFAEEFKGLVRQSGSKGTTRITGVGGTAEVEVIEVPRLQMRIGGFEALLEPATILTKDPGGNAAWYHVWAGIDIFGRAKRVSIDFRAMRLSAE